MDPNRGGIDLKGVGLLFFGKHHFSFWYSQLFFSYALYWFRFCEHTGITVDKQNKKWGMLDLTKGVGYLKYIIYQNPTVMILGPYVNDCMIQHTSLFTHVLAELWILSW